MSTKSSNFAGMKRGTYIFSLWLATLSVLLSTVVLHHHHMAQICLAVQQCHVDGNLNDEHTSHQENEQEGCTVHQMHHFIVNAKVVKTIRQHLLAQTQTPALIAHLLSLPSAVPCLTTSPASPDVDARILLGAVHLDRRRGPPVFS